MEIVEFSLERIQSLYENTVDYNLSDSGVHPYTVRELLTPDEIKCRLMATARPALDATLKPAYSVFQQGAGLISAYEAAHSSATGAGPDSWPAYGVRRCASSVWGLEETAFRASRMRGRFGFSALPPASTFTSA